jgi:hypothetical protein
MKEEYERALARLSEEQRKSLPPVADAPSLLSNVSGMDPRAFVRAQISIALRQHGEFAGPIFQDTIAEIVGVVSFSRCIDNSSMWNRYADDHRGMVIILDDQHAFFRPQPCNPGSPQNLREVKYVTARESRYITDLDIDELFFVKTAEWSSEQEIRMVRVLRDCTDTTERDANGYQVYAVELPPEAVTGAVFGAHAARAVRDELTARPQTSEV